MAARSQQRRRPVARKSSNASKKVERLKAWSFSRLAKYENCPRSARYAYIDKLPEPKAEAMERGSRIHKLAEDYVRKGGRLPKELKQFKDEFSQLRQWEAETEAQWAFDQNWAPTDWFGKDTWVRIMVDATHFEYDDDGNADTLVIIDHKTGKKKADGEYEDQLELYALGGFATWDVSKVRVELWFLDSGDIVPDEYYQRFVPAAKKRWAKRAARMLKDETFAPIAGFKCRWCPFNVTKGGPCEKGKDA